MNSKLLQNPRFILSPLLLENKDLGRKTRTKQPHTVTDVPELLTSGHSENRLFVFTILVSDFNLFPLGLAATPHMGGATSGMT
jgi:hypothetical protein